MQGIVRSIRRVLVLVATLIDLSKKQIHRAWQRGPSPAHKWGGSRAAANFWDAYHCEDRVPTQQTGPGMQVLAKSVELDEVSPNGTVGAERAFRQLAALL